MAFMGLDVPLRREACRTCGALNLDEAATRCQQMQFPSGDYDCPGDGPDEDDIDDEGFFRYPTEEGETIINDWIDGYVEDARARGDI